jgi:hypothetical protein
MAIEITKLNERSDGKPMRVHEFAARLYVDAADRRTALSTAQAIAFQIAENDGMACLCVDGLPKPFPYRLLIRPTSDRDRLRSVPSGFHDRKEDGMRRRAERPPGHESCRHTCWEPLPHTIVTDTQRRRPPSAVRQKATRIWNRIGRRVHEAAVEEYAAWVQMGQPSGRLARHAKRRVAAYALLLRFAGNPWASSRAAWTIEEDAAYAIERAEERRFNVRLKLDERHRVHEHLNA